ncbi:hypothetical protein DKZ29_09840 [Limosilactobacillus reuteri]|uniref:Uncharacterized protein n=2 Tax=Limosilactobacillus reuteri TaxID=1598 RepID=A0A855X972_LIMRT|nr:hypothetical protein [Limosilactobacillus reuteri]PWT34034.1 hypothetical protein DKZ21_00090 [Limosilactobacillus reuteri]PWT34261.1 hypothetical protein DKZ24_09890 [Limosilactobacillus reuteri]PWT39381.1 hypothetical protein DKZ22_11050 [Limosilactobacillus reuteri]PWT45466.1 hypothetical protein DKZ25_00090 [Limosilactobacillus reuteri]PWT57013.1 hypothetical protein DKZ29_09840 [Limosilactobacillus reuteri]
MKLTEKQKNCKYCHVGSKIESLYNGSPWDGTELMLERVDDNIVSAGEDVWGDIGFDPVNRTLTSWGEGTVALIIDISYCPFCGRDL